MHSEKLTVKNLLLSTLLVAVVAVSGACSGLIDEFPTTPDPIITTDTFNGTLTVNGSATHPVFTGATGSVVATLTSLGAEPPAKVGFSMGTLSITGNCNIVLRNDNAIVNTALTGTVSTLSGSLCVSVYDTGVMTAPVDYTFTVSHP